MPDDDPLSAHELADLAWEAHTRNQLGDAARLASRASATAASYPRRDRQAVEVVCLAIAGEWARTSGLASDHLDEFPHDDLVGRIKEAATMNSSRPPAIVVTGLRKSFGTTTVLDGIDLTVGEGSVFALLGPNGSGKTTTVRILSTLVPADAGRMHVAGHDVRDDADGVRAAIGVTGQFAAVDELFTGEENLRLMADLHHLGGAGRHRIAELLDRFDLVDAARKPVSTYSGGMRRRLDLAMTLVGEPAVIFLDEPTTGLDPRSRRTMWDSIRQLVATGVTIFLTTQYLDEADRLADHIAVLDRGGIVAEGSPDELKRRVPGGHVELQFASADALHAAAGLFEGSSAADDSLALQVPSDGSVAELRRLLARLDEAHVDVKHLSMHAPDLDDVFFAVTGRATAEEEAAS